MAAVRSLHVSVKPIGGSDRSGSDSDSESDRDTREAAEPMEVEEGELEAEDVSVNRSLKELLPDTSRRYENKAGAFITGIDVNSKEAIEKKEKRARRFHFQSEQSVSQRNVFLDKETMKKAITRLRMEAIYVTGVDDMSTQDVFGYFKEYPPAHIEWIDDQSCNVVWLDDDTSVRALINASRMPDLDPVPTETSDPSGEQTKAGRGQSSDDEDDEEEEGEVEEEGETVKKSSDGEAEQQTKAGGDQVEDLSCAERESLLRNDLRPAIKPFKGNKLFLRFATLDDKKELGAARRSRYYMKYGNPNYGGMKGILSNSWKRRFHNRRIQRDVIKSNKPQIGDSMGHTPPYTHQHSADLVNLPEEPIKEEEEEEDDDDDDEDMDSDDRVVEYKERDGGPRSLPGRSRAERSPSPWSESDEMDYDLELKMISTPSPKKSKKMTMYADELETRLKTIRDRVGTSESQVRPKSSSPPKVMDVRQLLEEKRQGLPQRGQPPPVASGGKRDVRQRLGKRRYSPDRQRSPSPGSPRDAPPAREPVRDVHQRLGVASQESRGPYTNSSKDRKTGGLWSRLGGVEDDSSSSKRRDHRPSSGSAGLFSSSSSAAGRKENSKDDEDKEAEEEDDSTLQKMWGAMIKQKQERLTHKLKKSRLDNLPSLQIEISRDTSDDSDA
ncbi:nuclear cap-binding protein subunit 3 isoform X2 [Cololabis saira]|uniref:nuclear cap-binding protein subunit 3 isoform X2 n=1 Tax=Cololabis saira TaxID=129043 RepID=UPI002AD1E38B|nr:nuclear cap-binding protein subunit 3 isoform X2 [Cololabis saira]